MLSASSDYAPPGQILALSDGKTKHKGVGPPRDRLLGKTKKNKEKKKNRKSYEKLRKPWEIR